MPRKYDIFISYARADRRLVHAFANELERRQIRVWVDAWEMQPGDVLRDRIHDGIAAADYFILVATPSSLDSNWVKYELASGLFLEIEAGHVRVIPAIAKEARFEDLPHDLRSKFGLDLRTTSARRKAADQLADLIKPEQRSRRELLQDLRNPGGSDAATIEWLRKNATRVHDQAIQVAAVRGLTKLPGPAPILAIAERAFDSWGMRGIRVACEALAKRASDGGLLALTASLCIDPRFYDDKIMLMRSSLIRSGDAAPPAPAPRPRERDHLLSAFKWFAKTDELDLRHGATLALEHYGMAEMLDRPSPGSSDVVAALDYAEKRLPGLTQALATVELRTFPDL